jgi:ankyrin repeat protein
MTSRLIKSLVKWASALVFTLPVATPVRAVDEAVLRQESAKARTQISARRLSLPLDQLEGLIERTARSNYVQRVLTAPAAQWDAAVVKDILTLFPGAPDAVRVRSRPALIQAAEAGNLDVVETLLAAGANVDIEDYTFTARSGSGRTALMLAIERGKYDVAEALLDAKANPNKVGSDGRSVLTLAATRLPFEAGSTLAQREQRQFDLVRRLLDAGANPLEITTGGAGIKPAIEQAFQMNRPALLDLMLTNSTRWTEIASTGDTLVHLAARWGRSNALTVLLDRGLPVNATNRAGLTPLQGVALLPGATSRATPAPITSAHSAFLSAGRLPLTAQAIENKRATAELLVARGAVLDVFSTAGLGKTDELADFIRRHPPLRDARDSTGRQPLHWAAIAGEPEAAALLLRAGVSPNVAVSSPLSNSTATTISPLHYYGFVAPLVKQPPDFDGTGWTPLHFAADASHSNLVSQFLAAKADPNAADASGQTPLDVAASRNRGDLVQLLLRRGAKLRSGDGFTTPLHHAVRHYNTSLIEALLRHGARIEARDEIGRTPLAWACDQRNLPLIELLLKRGANINAADTNGNTVLHTLAARSDDQVYPPLAQPWWAKLAAQSKWAQPIVGYLLSIAILKPPATPSSPPQSISLTTWLLERKASARATNRLGQTPLHLIYSLSHAEARSMQRQRDLIGALLKAGAEVNAQDLHRQSPLDVALASRAFGTVTNLLLFSPRLDLRDAQGRTVLHRLVETNLYDGRAAIQLLLKHGAPLTVRDQRGRTPLLALAANWAHGAAGAAEVLLDAGAAVDDRDNEGETFLHLAARARSYEYDVAQFIKQHEAQFKPLVNATNLQGDTPLHLAARSNLRQFSRALLDLGANPGARDQQGRTVYEIAAPFGDLIPAELRPPELRTDFFNAIAQGDLATVDAWLKFAPGLASTTGSGAEPPLRFAARLRQTNIADRLLAVGAPLDPFTATALGRTNDLRQLVAATNPPPSPGQLARWLHDAINFRQPPAARLLIEAGASLIEQDDLGHSALGLALVSAQTELADSLRQRGAKLNLFDSLALNDTALARELIEANPSLATTASPGGRMPIQTAVENGNVEMARQLFARGATLSGVPNLLTTAAEQGSVPLGRLLVEHGAQVNLPDHRGLLPLHRAAALGHDEFIALLLDHGAAINTPAGRSGTTYYRGDYKFTTSGATALHLAAVYARTNTVKFLLARGANRNAVNASGQTPLELVRSTPHGFAPPSVISASRVPPSQRPSLRDAAVKDAVIALLSEGQGK